MAEEIPEWLLAHKWMSGAEMLEKAAAERLNSGDGEGEEDRGSK